MLKRKILILAIIMVSLFTLSAVSASDNTTLDTIGIDDNDIEIANVDENVVLTDESPVGDFDDLSGWINETPENYGIRLGNDIKNTGHSNGIQINKAITIVGDGHIIDANHASQIFYINASEVLLKNIKFVNAKYNGQGGAINIAPNSKLFIEDSVFINCSSNFGGAIYGGENSTITIINSNFTNCVAESGGAVYLESGSNVNILDSNFNRNVAKVIGGSLLASGGNDISLYKTTFTNSSATHESGGAFALIESNLKAQYMQIIDCTSVFGGAITLLSSNSTISKSTFKRNSAIYDGGAIFAMYEKFDLSDSNFTDNDAQRGGALYISLTNNTIVYNRFEDNSASFGQAIYSMAGNGTIEHNTGLVDNYYEAINDNLIITGSADSYILKESSYEILPKYNMLDYNLLTPVKNQGTEGNCWAFTAMAVLESCILKSNTNITLDLSEANLKNIMALYSDYGSSKAKTNDGGNHLMASGYLASWLGPIFEKDDFYAINDYLSPLLSSVLHVQNIVFLKREDYLDNNAIKNAILKYGAVGTSMYYDDEYCNESSYSYYYNGLEITNHAVTIVGWDDDYSRFNFNNVPDGDGAWIVRNSWGPSWGNNGYFYVSYYDSKFAEINETCSYTVILNDTVRLDRNYQYEIEYNPSNYTTGKDEACYKNIFTVEGEEYLKAVSTYFIENCDYKVNIYVNGVLRTSQNGKADMGYYTIYLDNPISLSKNYNVTVEFNCTNFKSGVGKIPFSFKSSNTNLFIKENVSFYYSSGMWINPKDVVACIKMFTSFSADNKLNPHFDIECKKNSAENSYIISIILPDDATGIVSININGKEEKINISTTRSIKLFGLDENNNTLLFNYSGDDVYIGKLLPYVVDLNSDIGSFDELIKEIDNAGSILTLEKDYYYDLGFSEEIDIVRSITIDGNGHIIDANNKSVIFNVYANNTVLKNIRFIGGNYYGSGGAIYLQGSNCIFINCSFVNNSAYNGGAIYAKGSNSSIVNCSFVNNYASNYGGAIRWIGDGGILDTCSFVNNSAYNYAGAVLWEGSDGYLTNSHFDNNSILNSSTSGGALYWNGDNGRLTYSTFINNSAYNGGAIYWYGDEGILDNCSFVNNSAYNGGAIRWNGNRAKLTNSKFVNNVVDNYGGAVYLYGDDGVLGNCYFVDNSASVGGAIICFGENGNLTNSTFVNTLNINQIHWNTKSGNIIACKFLNTTHNNIVNIGANFVKNNISIFCNDTSFGYKNPQTLSLYVNNSYVPQLTFKFINGNTVRNITTDDISLVYDELATLSRGTWNLQVSFKEDDTYYSYDKTFTLDVIPATSSLTLTVDNITLGHQATIKATVLDISNSAVNEGSVVFYDGNNKIGTANVKNGIATLTYSPKTSGVHSIRADFSSENYTNSRGSADLFVDDIIINIISPEPGTVGVDSTFKVNVTALYSKVTDGNVSFYLNNQPIGKKALVDGIASLTYAPLIAGDLTLKVVYAESQKFSDNESSTSFHVNKAPSSIVLTQVNGTVGCEMTLTARVTSPNGNVNDGTVTFMDGSEFIRTVNVLNGVATQKYTPKTGGEHKITAKYSGDNYEDSNDDVTVYIDGVNIKIYLGEGTVGFNSTFNVNVTAWYSKVTDGSVSFFLNDQPIGKKTLSEGIASLTYVPLIAGDLTLKVVYDESQKFSKTENSTQFIVNCSDSNITIDSIIGAVVGSDLTLTAHVTSSNGQIINEGGVFFIDEIMDLGSADVIAGVATLPYSPLWSGNHTITARFYSSNYRYSEKDIKIFVNKSETHMAFSAGPALYYDTSATIDISISNNGKSVNSGTVRVYVNNQKIKDLEVSKGHVIFEYRPSSMDALNIFAEYVENFNYLSSNASATVSVNKLPTKLDSSDVTVVYNDVGNLVITLRDNNNKLLAGKAVSVNLNGQKQYSTNANGQIIVSTGNLAPKTYAVAISFAGDNTYLGSAKNVNVIIKKATPKLTAAKKTFKRKVKVKKYTITLKNNKNKAMAKVKVTIKVKGKTYTAKTNTKGKATFKITKLTKKGKHTATVTFGGDAYYNKVSKKVKITVK